MIELLNILGRKEIYIVLLILAGLFGLNISPIVISIIDYGVDQITNPEEMNLKIEITKPERKTSFLGLSYDGYDVKTNIINTGTKGFATIRCNVYNGNSRLIAHKDKIEHFDRNTNTELKFGFTDKELPDGKYNFKIQIINQIPDS